MVKKLLFILLAVLVVPIAGRANLIHDYGFESGSGRISTTAGYDTWSGDYATSVGPQQGINPYNGNQMLQFVSTNPNINIVDGINCDVYYYIDLMDPTNNYSNTSANNAYFTAYLNRVVTDDSLFRLFVYAFSSTTFVADVTKSSASWSTTITTDSNTATWERCDLNVTLPVGTRYAVVRISASGDMADNLNGMNFDGLYADNMYFDLTPYEESSPAPVPEPSTMLLLGSGMAGIACLRKRLRKD